MCRKEDNMLELVINNVRADGYVTDFTVSSAPKRTAAHLRTMTAPLWAAI